MARIIQNLHRRLSTIRRAVRVRMGQPTQVPLLPLSTRSGCANGTGDFDAERAWTGLLQQCAAGPRIPGSEAHRRTMAFLTAELGASVDRLAAQQWSQRVYWGAGAGARYPMTNLLGRIHGHEPGPPGLMLCAHWDTRPLADQDPDPERRTQPVPGANDGASGVAVLLEVARALSARRPRRDVVIGLLDGEDLGDYFYGSTLLARTLSRRAWADWKPAGVVVADMVGKRGLRCFTEENSVRLAPELWSRMRSAAEAGGVADRFDGRRMALRDDHIPFLQRGIPAILLIDYDYPAWHTTHDLPMHCSPESLQVVGRVLLSMAREAA